MNIGPMEILLVFVVILLLFGSTRLPKLARSIGQASKELKEGMAEGATGDTAKAEAKPETDAGADKS